jgi:hypothetical protein
MHTRKKHEEWQSRQTARVFAQMAVYGARQNAAREAAKPRWRCNWCHDGGIVLMSDGTPGSRPYACNHDGTRRPATPEEIAAYEQRAA